MARKITVSCVGGNPPYYPSRTPLGPGHDERLAQELVDHWRGRIETVLPDRPDLIVLPECSSRYQPLLDRLPAEEMLRLRPLLHERLLAYLRETARQHRCHLVYPSYPPASKEGMWHNAALVLDRSGQVIGQYDKQFITENETGVLSGGTPALIPCDFGTLGIVICFDLNFDEAFRFYQAHPPDVMVFPSMYHGGLMQAYRAYQCRAHWVSSMGNPNLRSEIRTPTGEVVAATTNYVSSVTAEINLDCALVHLDFNREKLHALKAREGRRVRITDPGSLGAVLVACESDETDVQTLLAEFGMVPLDAYLDRARAYQQTMRAGSKEQSE